MGLAELLEKGEVRRGQASGLGAAPYRGPSTGKPHSRGHNAGEHHVVPEQGPELPLKRPASEREGFLGILLVPLGLRFLLRQRPRAVVAHQNRDCLWPRQGALWTVAAGTRDLKRDCVEFSSTLRRAQGRQNSRNPLNILGGPKSVEPLGHLQVFTHAYVELGACPPKRPLTALLRPSSHQPQRPIRPPRWPLKAA